MNKYLSIHILPSFSRGFILNSTHLFIYLLLPTLLYAQIDTLWTKTYGGTDIDEAYSVRQTMNSGYIIVAYTRSFGAGGAAVWIIKTDSLGDTLWTKTYGGNNDDRGYSIEQTGNGEYIIVGRTYSFDAGEGDVWLLKLGEAEEVEEVGTRHGVSLQVYPNPFIHKTCIHYTVDNDGVVEIKIYDIAGNLVKELLNEYKLKGHYKIYWTSNQFDDAPRPGIYFCKINIDNFTYTKKLITL